ncbi:MAG: 4Fe-4S cluster-binding domain-containing protein [Candidatus Hodarchaeales archaeon]
MENNFHETPWGSSYTFSLSMGCKQCIAGEKLVVLVSTECNSNCFYCPLSYERISSPFSFANERPIKQSDDLIIENSIMNAKGASMTGGDPLEGHSFQKTLNFCKMLREKSQSYHIHVYTRGKELTPKKISEIAPYISEIRFHVKNLKSDFVPITYALATDLDIGIEIPVIPTKGLKYYTRIIQKFEEMTRDYKNFYFVNLNELEISETNYRKILSHGLECDPFNPSAVQGSFALGHEIVRWASEHSRLPVHFCALRTKDTVQLSNRLYRIAKAIQLPSDVVIETGSDKGLLIRGCISSSFYKLETIREYMVIELQIPEELVHIDTNKKRLLTNAAILEEIKDELFILFPKIELGISEEYPTYDQLQTTFIPLHPSNNDDSDS